MMETLIQAAVDRGAATLHIKAGDVFRARIRDDLVRLSDEPLSEEDVLNLALTLLPDQALRDRILEITDYDFAWEMADVARFRVNMLKQRGAFMIVMRVIPWEVPGFDDLGLPPVMAEIADQPDGLVLVSGATGQGKSTTQAAMIDWVNQNRMKHIITLEDPIEYWHENIQSTVTQREIERDTETFKTGLRSALRQDPDVILIGEMRDVETFETAFEASETGHLVISTMHSNTAIGAITHILAMFPDFKDALVRRRLADSLRAIVSQRLLSRLDGSRIPAVEVLIGTAAVRDAILQGEVQQTILRLMQEGDAYGMQTFDQHLTKLVKEGTVGYEAAKHVASNPADFELALQTLAQDEPPAEDDADFVSRDYFPGDV
ncbi:MAG: PilT/PilU family type 4a pilus ATPase [Gemmatimonadales bacterium]|jgi:twitching motility protein PilT